jgi:hypothetical protein
MTCNENNKLELGHVMWLVNNNEQEYRSKELPAPAETEVSEIVQAELERIHRRFMYERGINMADVPDQYVAKQWLEDQEPTEGFYEALKKLEMIFNINQIVSILSYVQTPGLVQFHTDIESESQYSVSIVYRSVA